MLGNTILQQTLAILLCSATILTTTASPIQELYHECQGSYIERSGNTCACTIANMQLSPGDTDENTVLDPYRCGCKAGLVLRNGVCCSAAVVNANGGRCVCQALTMLSADGTKCICQPNTHPLVNSDPSKGCTPNL